MHEVNSRKSTFVDSDDEGQADIGETFGLTGVVHEVNSRKSELKNDCFPNVNDKQEFPIVTSEASFRSRQTSVITGSRIFDRAFRTEITDTTDKKPSSVEGRRAGFSCGVGKSRIPKTVGTKSDIGGTIYKTGWQTKERKTKMKNKHISFCKSNLLVREGYAWDSEKSYWFFNEVLKSSKEELHHEQIDGTWKGKKKVPEYSKIHVPKRVGVLRAKPKDLELDQFDWNFLAYCACLGKAALLRRNILFSEGLPKERIFRPPPNTRDYQLYKAIDLDREGVEWPRYVSKDYLFDFSRTESIEPIALPGNVTPNLDDCTGCYDDLLNFPIGKDGKVVGIAFHNASKFLDAFCTVDRKSVEEGIGIASVPKFKSKAGAPLAKFKSGKWLPRPGQKQWRKHRREGLQPMPGEVSVPVATPGDVLTRYGSARLFIIDSGASVNATGKKFAELHFPRFIREKLNRGMMNTAWQN